MSRYLHERPDWPNFRWDLARLTDRLAEVRYRQGLLVGRMQSFGFPVCSEAGLAMFTQDAVASGAIEGEHLNVTEVRSSLARRLGVDIGGLVPSSEEVDGMVEMLLDATQRSEEPLTAERLWRWHAGLFPVRRWRRAGGRTEGITIGGWRSVEDGIMQIVSGPVGHERVHYEAPSAERLNAEMEHFLAWFNTPSGPDPVLKAGVAHLWFVSIHPFGDGNGRIARAIADCALARSDGSPLRFYSMSRQMEKEKKEYYAVLESTQKGDMDITTWLCWFVDCFGRAIGGADTILDATLRRARVWRNAGRFPLNERQRRVLNRLLDNFQGKLTSGQYARFAKCSPDTALRDIRSLTEYGLLLRTPGGGRSTGYALAELESGPESGLRTEPDREEEQG